MQFITIFIILIVLVVVDCSKHKQDVRHDDNDIKWRCIFRCGTKKEKTILGKTNTVCQDVGYVFYLNFTGEDEQQSLDQCNHYFDDITSDQFQQSKYFCSFSKCNPPISKEILPPLNFRHNKNDQSETTLEKHREEIHQNLMRINPLILQKLGDLDKQRLKNLWNKENMQLNEDHLLQQMDKQILQMKVDLCSEDQQLRETSELKLQKLSFFMQELENGAEPQKAMLLGLVGFTQFSQNVLEPFIKSVENEQLQALNEKLKAIIFYLRDIETHCAIQKRMKAHDIRYSPLMIKQVREFIQNNKQNDKLLFK